MVHNEGKTMYKLTKEHRYRVCIHEAAHAVIFAIGGAFIEKLVVAPEGATSLTCTTPRGSEMRDLWGVCSPCGLFQAGHFIQWSDDKGCFIPEQEWRAMLRMRGSEWASAVKRDVRASVCGILAGPIADEIQDGEPDGIHGPAWLEPIGIDRNDCDKAHGLAKLLVWREAFDSLAALTEQTLRRPDVWTMVVNLARELERLGDMEDFKGFLPGAVDGWPSSLRAKMPVVISALTISE